MALALQSHGTPTFLVQLTWQNAREEPSDIAATLRALDERVGLFARFGVLCLF